jgi:hypothetical protein
MLYCEQISFRHVLACQRFSHNTFRNLPVVSRYASPVQCPIQEDIEGIDDRVRIAASLRLKQLPADQCVNLAIAYFDRDAAQAFSPPLSVRSHAGGSE